MRIYISIHVFLQMEAPLLGYPLSGSTPTSSGDVSIKVQL